MTVSQAIAQARRARALFAQLMYADLVGGWHQVTIPIERLTPRLFDHGVGIDGSSVAGFRAAKAGDMLLKPDPATLFVDPFAAMPTVSMIGNLYLANGRERSSRCPRHVVQKAAQYLTATLGPTDSLWGPELEFYCFEAMEVGSGPGYSGYRVFSDEAGWHRSSTTPAHAARIEPRRGYHAASPEDRGADLRAEMCRVLRGIGIPLKYHHHEVGAPGQYEIEFLFGPLLQAADHVALGRFAVRNTAARAGKVASFLPKPLFGEAGSGLHFHQYLARRGKSIFYDKNGPARLSSIARFYLGGLMEHAPALCALANPSTNSYKRLVPGFEAPVRLMYSSGNRTAAIRIPAYARPDDMRVEYRVPDATCNPHLTVAAMLMAGLDGIRRKIDPGPPVEKDLSSLSDRETRSLRSLPTSLGEALDALRRDSEFLTRGDVFPPDLIEAWIKLKTAEELDVRLRPHPREYELYL